MFEFLADLYNKALLVSENREVFSYQVLISLSYLLALVLSMLRALKDKELFSDFLTIAVVVTKYMITTLLMEYALTYIEENHAVDNVQNVYLSLSVTSFLSMYILVKLHEKLSYKFGLLFFCVLKLTIIIALSHFILWFKFVVLDIQAEHAYIHYIYSFVVLYISIALAVVMLFPSLLKTKLKFLVSPSWPH
ncbi:hypothetical protein D0907_09755 [Pseudoalteromonas lipolytica]|jgi:hypothetical protein|uniref:Uncharacterized protein n=1 Tax=Pseudoalteromonas lipolytica TaxID=570156 RepID=A0AAD0RZQ5_9GAMM|nr:MULTISPECIES: hypothetical protein [Pseudoalteromonas]AXV65535.1 hypothetical protein D0907_09755 [Pseudoalteromonas donghaensis]MBE0349851.1 hypothetical protein [Pseudoalteromonas lipolytica LMEB 39]SFT81614.1 hypothetical protein SAMN04487854_110147 [Pseudoalteromonas lipolytica]